MKKIIVFWSLYMLIGQVHAQLVYSNGALISIQGAQVQINGGVTNKGLLEIKQNSNVVVKGDIDNQGKLSNDGYIDMYGNLWSTTKIDNPDFGEWAFSGSTNQSLTSDSAFTAKNLTFKNVAGFKLDVENDLKVTNTANFVFGILETINGSKLRFGSIASHTGASDASHVKGTVAKEGLGSFSYPVGTGTKHQEITINANNNPNAISVEYKAADAGSGLFGIAGPQPIPLQSYHKLEYWELNSGGAQGTVTVRHDEHNAMPFSNIGDLQVARQESTGPQWLNQGGTASGTTTSATIESLNSTLDGNFTLGIIKKDISILVVNPAAKTSICFQDTLLIHTRRVLSVNEYPTTTTFSVSPASAVLKVNDTTFKLFPSTTTNFVVTGIDQNNLEGVVNFNLIVNPLPNVVASIKNPIVVNGNPLNIWPKGEAVELEVSGAVSYSWSPASFVIGGTASSLLVAAPTNHITYTVIGIDAKGCKNTASVAVRAFVVNTENISSCTSIAWRNRTISETGFYGDTITSAMVDTIFVLNFKSNAVNVGIGFEDGKLAAKCMDCQYQWYACKPDGTYVPIENAKSRILSTTTKGSYTVEVFNGICSAKSPCISNVSTSSIASADESKGIAVYPNPFVDNLTVLLDKNPVSAYIQIVDLNGRVVHTKRVQRDTETTLNLSSLAQGAYLIQIVFDKQEKKMFYTKIIKE